MRVMNCDCGHTMKGESDDQLFQKCKQHIDEKHPEMMGKSDDEIREIMSERAQTQ